MGPFRVVRLDEAIQVALKVLKARIEPFSKRHPIKLVEERLVEGFANAGSLRALRLRARMLDILNPQVALVRMTVGDAALFGAAIGQDATKRNALLLEKWDHAVVEQVGGGDRRLLELQLGEAHFRIGVDEGLLIDPPDAL